MKKSYQKPAFVADVYQVTSSIAKCAYPIGTPDQNQGIPVSEKTQCCANDKGHVFGKGDLYADGYTSGAIFSDGPTNYNSCTFDWSGSGSVTTYDSEGKAVVYGDYGKAMFGAVADNSNHRPAYNGMAFFS